jgi:excisionase family DNA binding protein
METKRYLNAREAAEILGVHPDTVKSWLRKGKLKGFTTGGGYWRVSIEVLAEFANENFNGKEYKKYVNEKIGGLK